MFQIMEEYFEEFEDDDSDIEDLFFSSLDDDNVYEVLLSWCIMDF